MKGENEFLIMFSLKPPEYLFDEVTIYLHFDLWLLVLYLGNFVPIIPSAYLAKE